ncbi:MAG: cyclic nucleotide-binding domain-containing protein [Deltaproteobacteria bacterium]|nr:cyclic nucleotide-binding domain-containing protein [Deltaproteobacteria bacterium]MBL7075021.1 cyclic nucleotide-binding domain-containing protein [candidate division KSB1 bacterium]
MGNKNDFEFIKRSPLFRGLSEKKLARLIQIAGVETYDPGKTIIFEGTSSDRLFFLLSGTVEIIKWTPEGKLRVLTTLEERGLFFGELAIVDVLPRSATVRAKTRVELLVFHRDKMVELFRSDREILVTLALNVIRVLNQRIKELNESVASLSV